MTAIICDGSGIDMSFGIRLSNAKDRAMETNHTWLTVNEQGVLLSSAVNPDPTYVGSMFASPLVQSTMVPDHTLKTLKIGVQYSNMTIAFDSLLGQGSTVTSTRGIIVGPKVITKNQVCVGSSYKCDHPNDTLVFRITSLEGLPVCTSTECLELNLS